MTVTDASTGNPLGVYIGTVARPYSLGNLPFDLARDINYYWRVDEVNASNPYSPWKGEIWMFRNTDYLVIDDFNSYLGSDDMNQRWQTNYDLSPACYTNAQAGLHWDDNNQLMQFYYDNTGLYGVYFSEDRLDANGDDWTGAGALPAGDPVVALAISYLGNAFNTADPTYDRMYIGLEDIHGDFNMVLNPDPNAARNFYQWNQWNIALADLGVPSPVNLSAVKYLYLGFGERCNYYVPGGSGTVLFDDLRLYQRRCVPDLNSPPGDFSHDCRVDLYDVEVMSQEWLSEGIVADIYPQGSRDYIVNFRDFAVLAGKWLTETVWP